MSTLAIVVLLLVLLGAPAVPLLVLLIAARAV